MSYTNITDVHFCLRPLNIHWQAATVVARPCHTMPCISHKGQTPKQRDPALTHRSNNNTKSSVDKETGAQAESMPQLKLQTHGFQMKKMYSYARFEN